jgi:hypothetical protein
VSPWPSAWLTSARRAKIVDATAAEPYVVTSDRRFADSSWLGGTRLGTLASFAGIQNSDSDSIRKVATSNHHRVRTMGIEA